MECQSAKQFQLVGVQQLLQGLIGFRGRGARLIGEKIIDEKGSFAHGFERFALLGGFRRGMFEDFEALSSAEITAILEHITAP